MIEMPWILHTPAWVQLGPPLALLVRRNRSRPLRWIAAGAAVSVVGNWLGRIAAHRVGNNHWVADIDSALMFSLYLIALTEWQVDAGARQVFRVAVFALLLIYMALIALVEDVTTFSRFAFPMYSLALMGGAIWTLLRRAFAAFHRPLLRTEWFWALGGLALLGAVTAVVEPISKIFLDTQRLDLLVRVYSLRAIGVDLAFLLILTGFFVPPDPEAALQ